MKTRFGLTNNFIQQSPQKFDILLNIHNTFLILHYYLSQIQTRSRNIRTCKGIEPSSTRKWPPLQVFWDFRLLLICWHVARTSRPPPHRRATMPPCRRWVTSPPSLPFAKLLTLSSIFRCCHFGARLSLIRVTTKCVSASVCVCHTPSVSPSTPPPWPRGHLNIYYNEMFQIALLSCRLRALKMHQNLAQIAGQLPCHAPPLLPYHPAPCPPLASSTWNNNA